MLPKARPPAAILARARGEASTIDSSLAAAICGATMWPARRSSAERSTPRRSLQTTSGLRGAPVSRSQITALARWEVTPTAARSAAVRPAWLNASPASRRMVRQMARASCSMSPGAGARERVGLDARARSLPSGEKTPAPRLEVPTSRASRSSGMCGADLSDAQPAMPSWARAKAVAVL